ncbi:MAG: 2-dehydropantoate 2-reductase [Dehalococcoidia bacterium]|nr:2-dehydropantoate 2-reductase [Dehalococcoidia bacterium]MDW8120452.1 2-dehydropantoate 2-reductase [Chloroflexota bacterium]
MRIAVMGSGAVGGYLGALLARAGHHVTCIARGPHLRAIHERGLRIESTRSGTFTIHLPATDTPAHVGPVDLVLFCVKTYSNPEAIPLIAPLVGPESVVLTLQNGVDNGEQLAAVYGRQRVMAGAVYIESRVAEPGVIVQSGPLCRVVFGELDESDTSRGHRLAETFRQAGIDAVFTTALRRELWTKFLFIASMSGVACLTRAPVGEWMEFAPTRDLYVRALREVEQVARALDIPLDAEIVPRTVEMTYRFRKEALSSMQVDLLQGRRLEISSLSGAVSRYGKQAGVPTPIHDTITAVLSLADEQAKRRLTHTT